MALPGAMPQDGLEERSGSAYRSGPELRVHRLATPERGAQSTGFSGGLPPDRTSSIFSPQ
jgi:hypothetical protein